MERHLKTLAKQTSVDHYHYYSFPDESAHDNELISFLNSKPADY